MMAMTRSLSRSALEEIMFSAVRESGNKPIRVSRDWLYTIFDGFGRAAFPFQRPLVRMRPPSQRWRVDYETSTGEVRHFKIFTYYRSSHGSCGISTPESVREDVRKAISEK